MNGEIICAIVETESNPFSDKSIEANNGVLKELPNPFYASFSPETGAAAEDDGRFGWSKEINLE